MLSLSVPGAAAEAPALPAPGPSMLQLSQQLSVVHTAASPGGSGNPQVFQQLSGNGNDEDSQVASLLNTVAQLSGRKVPVPALAPSFLQVGISTKQRLRGKSKKAFAAMSAREARQVKQALAAMEEDLKQLDHEDGSAVSRLRSQLETQSRE